MLGISISNFYKEDSSFCRTVEVYEYGNWLQDVNDKDLRECLFKTIYTLYKDSSILHGKDKYTVWTTEDLHGWSDRRKCLFLVSLVILGIGV